MSALFARRVNCPHARGGEPIEEYIDQISV